MDGNPGDAMTVGLALHALELSLRRAAECDVRAALRVTVLRLAGYDAREVQERLELSSAEYRRLLAALREAARA